MKRESIRLLRTAAGIAGWVIGNQFNALVAYNQDEDVWEQTKKA